jgi:cell wall-associated NlpC family hydrolase
MTARAGVGAVAAALLAVAALSAPASADQLGDKQREAQQIANQIDQLSNRAASLGEALNGAQLALDKAQADVKASEDKLSGYQQKLSAMRSTLGDFAVRAYVYADQTSGLAGLLAGTSVTDGAAQRTGYQAVALGANLDMTDDMKATIEDAQREQTVLDAKRKTAAKLADAYAGAQKQAQQALADQQAAQQKVNGELATLVAQAQQRQAAAAQAAAAAAQQAANSPQPAASPQPAGSRQPAAAPQPAAPAPASLGAAKPAPASGAQKLVAPKPTAPPAIDIPATSPGAAIAVRAALSQVGKSYRFAAAGPDAYDCSGLTMWAWSQAGVSLPHYSKAQFDSLPHVPLDALQPGDLVFFYSSVSHVGVYIGGGQMVDAANPALGVRVAGIGGAIGAARP